MTLFHVIKYPVHPNQRTGIYPEWVIQEYQAWLRTVPSRQIRADYLCKKISALLMEYDPEIHGEAHPDGDSDQL